GQRASLQPPDGLPLEQLPEELHQGQDELRHRPVDVVRIGVPPQRRAAGGPLDQLGPQRVALGRSDRRDPRPLAGATGIAPRPPRAPRRALQSSGSGPNEYGGQGPLTATRTAPNAADAPRSAAR